MSNFPRLATTNANPRKPACTTCLHYHVNLGAGLGVDVVSWHWTWPFRRISRAATAHSYGHAICSFYGGQYASTARESCDGADWEPNDALVAAREAKS